MSLLLSSYPNKPPPSPVHVVPAPTDPEALLTIAEVALIVRVDQSTVRRWIKNGYLTAVQLPRMGRGTRANYRVKRRMLDILINGLDEQSSVKEQVL